jgi:hypothetical protein
MTQNVQMLIERVNDLKARTKEANNELKAALEQTQVFQDVFKSSLEDKRYNVTEKIAKAHALKVALKHFSPQEED